MNLNPPKSVAHLSRIHDLIPGGAHTYCKGHDQFSALAPAAISRGKGTHFWDVDRNKFLDCAMGLTSVSLGNADRPMLEHVKTEPDRGVKPKRPSLIEGEMAERFFSLLPHHNMIKSAKNGSTATIAAVKLARAATGRKLVPFHPINLSSSSTIGFVGPTNCSLGVHGEFSLISVTFKGYDIGSLRELSETYPDQIACVTTEAERNSSILKDHLEDAIELTHRYGTLLMADQLVTGFKTAFAGTATHWEQFAD